MPLSCGDLSLVDEVCRRRGFQQELTAQRPEDWSAAGPHRSVFFTGAAMEDVTRQLAGLLGKGAMKIRKTDESPSRISVIDVTMAVAGGNQHDAARILRRLSNQYPEVGLKFKGRGQRETPVADARGIVEIIMLLPGHHAACVRRQASELLVRYLGGDLALVDEVCALRGLQAELAAQQPEDPRRAFGEAVEAAPHLSSGMEGQLARACADAFSRVVPEIVGKLTMHIDERLGEDRQRVNLNVRTPKRASPSEPPITRNIAGVGRPLPLARFLDEKEAADPSWRGVRKSLAPFFGMQTQILKKKKLQDESAQAIYVEQNHRPQLLYVETDRALMEEAWGMIAAHREDLVRRSTAPLALPGPDPSLASPSVLDMLQRA
jgi:hypothetical protein